MTVTCVKRALKRDPTVPAGIPSLLHVDCGCGQEVPIVAARNTCAGCGVAYDTSGWILSAAVTPDVVHALWVPAAVCTWQTGPGIYGSTTLDRITCRPCRVWKALHDLPNNDTTEAPE